MVVSPAFLKAEAELFKKKTMPWGNKRPGQSLYTTEYGRQFPNYMIYFPWLGIWPMEQCRPQAVSL